MRILLTNDDGFGAAGLSVLEALAATISDDIWLVAPGNDQSGKSHCMSFHNPLRIIQQGEKSFSVDGSPADCVVMAVGEIMPGPPDLVLSGVNFGSNVADDFYYSGTIAATREAALSGYRAIGLSQSFLSLHDRAEKKFAPARQCGADLLAALARLDLPDGAYLNVNFPSCEPGQVKGWRVVRQGARCARPFAMHRREDLRRQTYFWIGARTGGRDARPGTDLHALAENFVSITPHHIDMHYGWYGEVVERQLP